MFVQRRLVALLVGLAATPLLSCGDSDDGSGSPTEPNPDFTMAVSPSSVTVQAGDPAAAPAAAARGDVNVTVTISRSGGFSGAVTVTVEGLPTGVTASALTVASGQSSGTVTLTASGSAAAGASTLTVRGSASGITAKTASVALTVTATAPPAGEISLSLSPSSLSIAQGATGSATVTVTRTDFTGDVSLTATSDPAGLQATFDPATVSGTSSALSVSVPAGQAPGSYTVTVVGSGAGVESNSASLSVTVTASSGSGNVSFTFCEDTGLPVWVAYQDGAGAWTQATATPPATYSFDISSNTAGVAWVTTDGGSILVVYYGSRDELQAIGAGVCEDRETTKMVTGTMAGVGVTQRGFVTMGGASAAVQGGGSAFSLDGVSLGPVDLIASRGGFQSDGMGGFSDVLDALIIRRDLDPADGSVLPVLDFNSSEAFAPVERNLTVTNDMGQFLFVFGGYATKNGASFGSFFSPSLAASSYFGVPSGEQADGDLHSLTVTATALQNDEPVTSRNVTTWFKDAVDKTITLGPELSSPTVTIAATSPVVRPRMQLPTQSEYDRFWTIGYGQDERFVSILVFEGFGVGATLDIAVPDLSGAAGWQNDWGLGSAETFWTVLGSGFQGGGGGESPIVEGATNLGATRFGTINP
jgi:hypothetical protein